MRLDSGTKVATGTNVRVEEKFTKGFQSSIFAILIPKTSKSLPNRLFFFRIAKIASLGLGLENTLWMSTIVTHGPVEEKFTKFRVNREMR